MAEKTDLSVVGYILGIIAVVMAIVAPLTLAGVVFGVIGLVKSRKAKTKLEKKARTLNIIGIILALAMFAVFWFWVGNLEIPV